MPLEEKPMADDNNSNGATNPTLSILAQYTKDLSFENPGAPRSLQARDKAPTININVNVNANPLSDTDFDVVLSLNAEAKDGDKTVFHTELAYGGVFRVAGFPQEHMPLYPHFEFCGSVSADPVDDGEEIDLLKAGPQPIHRHKKNHRSGRTWNHFQIRIFPEHRKKWRNPSDVFCRRATNGIGGGWILILDSHRL